jgi:hypothetical protein
MRTRRRGLVGVGLIARCRHLGATNAGARLPVDLRASVRVLRRIGLSSATFETGTGVVVTTLLESAGGHAREGSGHGDKCEEDGG